jgi:hypothetical protein
MAIKRNLKSATQKVGKKHKRKARMTPAEKLAARKSYARRKKHMTGADKHFDKIREAFRKRHGKRRPGRPTKPGAVHPVAAHAKKLASAAREIAKKVKARGGKATKGRSP